MGTISRGIKNAFRNTIRTISVTFILALAIAMSLIMLMSYKTVQAKIVSVKASIGNIITVSPAGVRGFEGGGTLLTDQNATDIGLIPGVNSVVKTISDRLTNNTNTNLTSPITPGSFGNRERAQQNGQTPPSSLNINNSNQNFTMPIMATGTNNIDSLASIGVSQFSVTSGNKIDANSSESIAMIGKDLAEKNNLAVGGTFIAYGQNITVFGIYDSGNTFSNATVIFPLKTLQNLSSQAGQVNTIIVETNSIDNISSVQDAIKQKLGSAVDVTSEQDSSQNAIAPLENIKNISLYSLIGSVTTGAIIIFLIMMMIVRERRCEIGVLKAIGSSNSNIMAQFTVESLVLTLMSSIAGIILGFIFSNPILKVLINNSTSSSATNNIGRVGGPGGGFGGAIMRLGGGAQNTIQNLHAVLNYEIILYGLLAAIIIAILGSIIPAYIISKIRPAEVMRGE